MKPAVLKRLSRMMRLPAFAIVFATLAAAVVAATVAPSSLRAAPRDLFAQGTEQQIWAAEVVTKIEVQVRVEQTRIRHRSAGEGAQWREGEPLAGRAIALATRGGELLVLMNSGDW